MSGLVEFLRARYTEAREREEAKRTLRNDVPFEFTWSYEMDREYVEIGSLKQCMAAEDFWAQYGVSAADPDVLADLDVKLAILDLHARLGDSPFCATCDAPSGIPGQPDGCATLRLLAVPFAKHPDYDERWRP